MEKNTSSAPYKIICGCDCAYSKDGKIQICASVLTSLYNLEIVEYSISKSLNPFPYMPGKFYLREGEISIKTIKKLKNNFDLLLINGHGKGNVEGKGLATYIGEKLKVPTIGITKELLFGKFKEPEKEKGNFSEVKFNDKTIAYALRTKDNIKPIFLSEGFNIVLKKNLNFINSLCIYKIPEPLRLAHLLAKENLKKILSRYGF